MQPSTLGPSFSSLHFSRRRSRHVPFLFPRTVQLDSDGAHSFTLDTGVEFSSLREIEIGKKAGEVTDLGDF